ncbi:Fungal specific transcription factor domain containing protein [Hyaloscypha variabilis]
MVPYILSGLLSGPVPDLAILQTFLVLECYGMYRAGPYQRENAILIHGLLLNSIRRISRYHVRARITLPDRLTYKERDWMEFAYAEQYKRLILFFFIWDTQNATCYSFMPNMSIQSLQIGLPCSRKLWEATNGIEWKELLSEHDYSSTLLDKVKKFINSDHEMLQKPYDSLSFNLTLHGLMSMANDMLHFDNRSIYAGEPQKVEMSWSPGQQQIAQSLESWKAKYDAFAMETIFDMNSEPLHCAFQRDSMAIFALYHTGHIIINCEICHLQTAAGAKAIFGYIVTPSDYEENCRWVRNWVRNSPESAGRAA